MPSTAQRAGERSAIMGLQRLLFSVTRKIANFTTQTRTTYQSPSLRSSPLLKITNRRIVVSGIWVLNLKKKNIPTAWIDHIQLDLAS